MTTPVPAATRALLGLLIAALIAVAPRSVDAAPRDAVFDQVKAERDAADAVWAAGSPLVALERFLALADRLADEDQTERVFLRASIEARLGSLNREIGAPTEAEHWWNLSLEDYQSSGRLNSSGRILANLAIARNEAGRSDLAVDWLSEAINLHRALDRPLLVAFELYLRGAVLRERGEFGPALADVLEAIDLFEEHGDIDPGGGDRTWYLHCRGFIAEYVLRLGEPQVAADELGRILSDEALDDPRLSAEWQLLLASALAATGEHQRAEAALEEARRAIESHGLFRLGSALLRIEADITGARGELAESCRLVERAWEEAVDLGLADQQLLSGAMWAGCLNDLGDFERGILVAREHQLMAEASGSARAWEGWYQQARGHQGLGALDLAADAWAEAAQLLTVVLEDLRLDTVAMSRWRLDFDGVFDGAATARLAVATGPADIEAALDLVEQSRSRLLLSAVLGGSIADPSASPDPSGRADVDGGGLPGPTRSALRRVRRLDADQHRPWLERLRVRAVQAPREPTASHSPDLRRARSLGASTVSVATLRRRLPRNMGVALFRSDADRTDLFWVEHDRVELHRLAVDDAELTRLADDYVSRMAHSVSDPAALPGFEQASRALRAATLGPIEERLRGVRHLVVVPDGDLYRVPFAALRRDDRYLLEQATVSIAPSLNILDALLDQEHDRIERFVGVADPGLDLPQARLEVAEAASRFSQPAVLMGEQAGLRSVLDAAVGADVLHFATHGELEAGGEPSWLALAGNDALDAEAILDLRLDLRLDLPLVTLSACRSARGSQQAGEALVNSLARSFLAAGAESVVGSLWDVHDGSTRALMGRFNEALASGSFVADSLADAQRGLALSDGPWVHPWYWAGFVVVGDPR